jgi:4-hydroxythreonine-4-phosphate dehydrogenase|tara:strand:+ start:7348 stop:8349 length:1002 start_codon:yes stop_codon:yes gene_type:complete
MPERTVTGVTLGDPSGVGPEVVVKAFADPVLHEESKLFVIGAIEPIQRAIEQVGLSQSVRSIKTPSDANSSSDFIDVFELDDIQDTDFPMGVLSEKSARASHAWVEAAIQLALAGSVDAITTAPVNKEAWRLAGFSDKGHQEVLQRLTGADYVATMLVSGSLRCMHLSTHLSLSEACDYVTKENVLRAINLTHEYFIRWGVTAPRIGVAALNPHASDGGLIGQTEEEEILPAVVTARAAGIDAIGPVPADTVFNQAIDGRYDVVLVMYHDQGHIPIKVYGFENSITVNLGIPILRTSVDHGTAFDIAGKNQAQSVSMVEAIKLARSLSSGQHL